MIITNSIRKQIASLDQAKARREEGLFVAEGTKCVQDTLRHFALCYFAATRSWLDRHAHAIDAVIDPDMVMTVKHADMERMSHLSTPPEVLAVYRIPDRDIDVEEYMSNVTLVLDRIQDPGNLGTIMRVADWEGVRQIVASPDTVDVWSPKVVQATMGAISRVKVVYRDLDAWMSELPSGLPVAGTFMHGDNIHTAPMAQHGLIVMGNEGRGISDAVAGHVTQRLHIPSYPPGEPTSESLNVAVATAITLAFLRQKA